MTETSAHHRHTFQIFKFNNISKIMFEERKQKQKKDCTLTLVEHNILCIHCEIDRLTERKVKEKELIH